jgi:menaquinol-cytochrome c reductase cytochrome b/c subunit
MGGLPEHILRRSAEARAKAEGRDVEEVLAEMKGEAPPKAEAEAPPKAEAEAPPKAEAEAPPKAEAEAPPAPSAAPTPAAPAPAGDLEAEAKELGIPVRILQRSLQARARKEGRELVTAGAPAPAAAPAATATPAAAPAAPPAAAPPIPEGVSTQRLLTVVKAGAIQQVKSTPTDKVSVWPHLLAIEFVALLVVLAGLILFSVFVNAPLLELANFNEQPNPSKAPWYFLGLQEMLSYFDPQVAGVIIPTFGLIGLAIIPYVDKNPAVKPSDRKLAIMIFSFFLFAAAVLTIYGSFFRGPGFNFTFPWKDGIFFDF